MVNKKFVIVIAIVVVAIAIGAAIFTSSANRLAETSISGGNPSAPVLLVHGLGEDASMWKRWEELLAKDGIQYHTITFQDSDDKCGRVRKASRRNTKGLSKLSSSQHRWA